MAPLDAVVERALGVVLVEEVIGAVPLAHAVGIVEPTGRGNEVEARPERVGLGAGNQFVLGNGGERVGQFSHAEAFLSVGSVARACPPDPARGW